MVTKQEQLEWMAKSFSVWPGFGQINVVMSKVAAGEVNKDRGIGHSITREEWQQERDRMSSKPEVDNSWHDRGELPPVGCECNYVTGISCVQVKIQGVGHVDGYHVAFFAMKDSWCTATAEFFRPLRTEREKAIDEMAGLISVPTGKPNESTRLLAGILYDDGYRKQ